MKFLVALVLIAPAAHAQAPQQAEVATTPQAVTSLQPWQQIDRAQWTLSREEWVRYEQVMRGPRGIWSPNLDPLTALGVEAKTDAERRRFAEQLVQMEKARVDRELAFARAYSEAWQRLHPDAQRIDPARLASLQGKPGLSPAPAARPVSFVAQAEGLAPGDRIALFFGSDCPMCVPLVQGVLGLLGSAPRVGVDLYVLDGSPATLHGWATRAQLPPALVSRGTITLNADGGVLAKLTQGRAAPTPAAFRRRGDQFTPIDLRALATPQLYQAVRSAAP